METEERENFPHLHPQFGKKKGQNSFFNREDTQLMGKSSFRGLMRISPLNTRCGMLNKCFQFLNLWVAHLIDKAVTWVLFALPRWQFVGQEMSGQLLGAQSVARKPVNPPFITFTRAAVWAETSHQKQVNAQRLVLVCSYKVCTNQRSCGKGNPTVLLHQLLQLVASDCRTKQ